MVEDLYYDDYPEAKAELIKAIERGRLPLLTQELNAYDCIQAIFELDAINNPKDEEDAFFDGTKVRYIDGRQTEITLIPSD